jgi:hypothetical protein
MVACIVMMAFEVYVADSKILVPKINYVHDDVRLIRTVKGRENLWMRLDENGGIYGDYAVPVADEVIKHWLKTYSKGHKKIAISIRVNDLSKTSLKTIGDAVKRIQRLVPPDVKVIYNVAPY